MSRRDTYHDLVKQALIREGWQITHDPYTFKTKPELTTDLGAERTIAAERGVEKIAVEIKSFLGESKVVNLEQAIGQYMVYSVFLNKQEPDRVLYLAIPRYAYESIFATEVGKTVTDELNLNLIVFALTKEEGLLWQKR